MTGRGAVYLDHAATTPVRPEAVEALLAELAHVGNPSSQHTSGRRARRVVEESRESIASALGVRAGDVVFTSGGTEADNLAVLGLFRARRAEDPRRTRVLASAVEHHAVLDPVEWLGEHEGADRVVAPGRRRRPGRPRLAQGRARRARRRRRARHGHVGQQRGRHRAARRARSPRCAPTRGIPFHSDAVQAVGIARGRRVGASTRWRCRGTSSAARRASARSCCGAASTPVPLVHGGGQEREIRSGTLDAPGIAGARCRAHGVDGRLRRAHARASRGCATSSWRGCSRRSTASRATATRPCVAARHRAPVLRRAARATRCCCCSTPPASSARAGRPARPACRSRATCCSRWASSRSARPRVAALLPRLELHRGRRRPAASRPCPAVVARARRAGRAADEGRRRAVRRGRLGGRRGSRGRGRPRRHGHPPRARAQPAEPPHRCPGLLHARGRARRPPRGRRPRHPVLRVGPLRAVRRGRHGRLRRRVRRRPHAQPVPAVQRADQVLRRARPCARRSASTPSPPVTTRGSSTRRAAASCTAPSTPAKDQSYVLAVLDAGAARRRDVPARRHRRKPEVRAEAARRGLLVADKPDSHDICFIPDGDTARLAARPSRRRRRATSSTRSRGRRSGTTTARSRSPSASAAAFDLGRPAADGGRRYVVGVDVATSTVMVGPPVLLEVDRVEGARPRWCGPAPDGPLEGAVQLRAHGEPVDAVVVARGDRARRTARRVAAHAGCAAWHRARRWWCTTAHGWSAARRSAAPRAPERLTPGRVVRRAPTTGLA